MDPRDRPAPATRPHLRGDHGFRFAVALLIVQAIAALGVLHYRWQDPPLDRFESRQTQTALTAYWMAKDGWQLAAPLPLFGPPWSVPMEFPFYQSLVVAAMKLFHLPLVPAARTISVLMLFLTLPAIWRLGRGLGWSATGSVVAMAAALSPPVFLFYGRAVLIESTAVCACAWYFAEQLNALRQGTPGKIALAAALGVIAGLAKMTTFIVFAVPVCFCMAWPLLAQWRGRSLDRAAIRRALLAGVAPLVIAFAVNLAWIAWSDAIKNSNPLAQPFKSGNLHGWHYGTLALRLTAEFWTRTATNALGLVLAPGALIVVVVAAALVPSRARWLALGFTAAYLCAPLLFPNLYMVHDYYSCGNALLLMLAAAALLAGLWDGPAVPRRATFVITLLFFATQWAQFVEFYWPIRRTPPPLWSITEAIRLATPPDDVFVTFGADWGSLWAYGSQRRAIMVRSGEEPKLPGVLRRLAPSQKVATVLIRDHYRNDPAFVAEQIARFQLAPMPVAEDEGSSLFVREDLLADAAAKLRGLNRPDLTVNLPDPTDADASRIMPQDISLLDAAKFHPAPIAAGGIAAPQSIEIEGQPAWFLHAPAELVFTPASGARGVTIELGMIPDSYAVAQGSTDGVDVILLERLPGGIQRILQVTPLRPTEKLADRGIQRLSFEQASPLHGQLVIRIATGPAHRNNRDWVYLARVEIR
jgi:hypothetical protein